jgi:hypothetical protein
VQVMGITARCSVYVVLHAAEIPSAAPIPLRHAAEQSYPHIERRYPRPLTPTSSRSRPSGRRLELAVRSDALLHMLRFGPRRICAGRDARLKALPARLQQIADAACNLRVIRLRPVQMQIRGIELTKRLQSGRIGDGQGSVVKLYKSVLSKPLQHAVDV